MRALICNRLRRATPSNPRTRVRDELRDPAYLQIPHTAVGEKELDMAVALVKAMGSKWDPAKYHDEYRQALMKLIEEKVSAGAKPLPKGKPAPKQHGKVIDLVSLLQESLGKSGARSAKKSKTTKQRVAPHKKAA